MYMYNYWLQLELKMIPVVGLSLIFGKTIIYHY